MQTETTRERRSIPLLSFYSSSLAARGHDDSAPQKMQLVQRGGYNGQGGECISSKTTVQSIAVVCLPAGRVRGGGKGGKTWEPRTHHSQMCRMTLVAGWIFGVVVGGWRASEGDQPVAPGADECQTKP